MKKLLTISILILLAACETESVQIEGFGDGVYTGTFSRGTPTSLPVPIDVTIEVRSTTFKGSSNGRLPTICNGTFEVVSDKKITFKNECFFTADFDWTYILDGEFEYHTQDGFLYLTKRYPDNWTYDTYRLQRISDVEQ